jgi:transposase-like protein
MLRLESWGQRGTMVYTNGFKARMVRRMAGTERISANLLSQEVGIAQPTLSRWLRDARRVEGMNDKHGKSGQGGKKKTWSAEEKLRVLGEATRLTDEELGAFLRSKGVHEATLNEWQKAAVAGLEPASSARRKKSPEAKKIKELERDLHRKDKALAEMAALITLQKKAQAIWGDGGDGTDTKKGT